MTSNNGGWTAGRTVRDYGEPILLDHAECRFAILDAPDGAPVAYVYQEENAALYAAAPDLYEALEEAEKALIVIRRNVMTEVIGGNARFEGVPEILANDIQRTRAALLRANPSRGEK